MLTAIALGVAQGARHSLEPDHLAAVSVLVRETRSLRRSAWLGAIWGIGHTLALVAVGAALAGFGAALPPAADRGFELVVAAMLIVLGIRSIVHVDHHTHAASPRATRSPLQALIIGTIHGMAGSGTLTAFVFAALPTATARILYMSLFGLGSIAGMAIVSGATGAGLDRLDRPSVMRVLAFVIGTCSIAIGMVTGLHALAA